MSGEHDIMTYKKKVMIGASISGLINAIINGAVQWFLLPGDKPIALTVNNIVNSEDTVLGAAVPLAVSLAMILTAVAYTSIEKPKPSFFPSYLWLVLKHGIFTLGLIVTFAVFWQRIMGEVYVSLVPAVIMLGVIAGIVSAIVNYMTITASRPI